MATMPPNNIGGESQMQPPAQATEGMDTAPVEGQEETGYTLCINVTPDGQLAFGVEREGMEPTYKPAESIKEALTMALEAYKADGQAADDAGADAEFNAGYADRGMGM